MIRRDVSGSPDIGGSIQNECPGNSNVLTMQKYENEVYKKLDKYKPVNDDFKTASNAGARTFLSQVQGRISDGTFYTFAVCPTGNFNAKFRFLAVHAFRSV